MFMETARGATMILMVISTEKDIPLSRTPILIGWD
jgi:hypothetical protein